MIKYFSSLQIPFMVTVKELPHFFYKPIYIYILSKDTKMGVEAGWSFN